MLYHFEFRGEAGWEAVGSGDGAGAEPEVAALLDLMGLAGGCLPEGEYRCIAAISESTRWGSFRLGPGGEIDSTAE